MTTDPTVPPTPAEPDSSFDLPPGAPLPEPTDLSAVAEPVAVAPTTGSYLDLPPLPDILPPEPAMTQPGPTWEQPPNRPVPGYAEQSAAQSYGHGARQQDFPRATTWQPTPPASLVPTAPQVSAPRLPGDATLASMSHWLPLAVNVASGGFLGFLAPLVLMNTRKDDPLVRENAKESLNFSLTMLLAAVVSYLLMIVLVGFLTIAVVGLLQLILQILAAIAAARGEVYRYPVSIRFIR